MTESSIMQYWAEPDFSPRDVQIKALEWIEKQSAKYLFLQAPVASGKSHIAITASNYFGGNGVGNAFVLTPQRILQKQYDESFQDDVAIALYGKANYVCDNKNCSCDIGSQLKPVCTDCPYTAAVKAAVVSPNVIMNYQLAFLMMTFQPQFSEMTRKLMVIDECHNLEEALISFTATTIPRKMVESDLGIVWPMDVQSFAEFRVWSHTSGYMSRLVAQQEHVENQVKQIKASGSKITKADIKVMRRLLRLDELVSQSNFLLTEPIDTLIDNYVFDCNLDNFTIRSLYATDQFMTTLAPRAEKFLFMSGTVDAEGFCKDIGIPIEEAAFLSLDSPIPAANRSVVSIPTIRMNYEWMAPQNKKDRDKVVGTISGIIDQFHTGESGIIHTANYKVAGWVVGQLTSWAKKRGIVLVDHNPSDDETESRDQAIARYLNNVGNGIQSILISPSCTEGLDLKGDLGRYSIILKVPFGYLGDKWIKKRMTLSKEWYARQALYQTLQAAGRVVRDPADHGTTYILDMSWGGLMNSTSKLIPKWWRDGYHTS